MLQAVTCSINHAAYIIIMKMMFDEMLDDDADVDFDDDDDDERSRRDPQSHFLRF